MNWYNEVEALTKELVKIKSVTEAPGEEQRIAEHIFARFKALPYFAEENGALKIFATDADTVKRSSVLAMVRGTKNGGSNKTVILLGHVDTVDVKDYAGAEALATDPDRLPEALKALGVNGGVLEDLESGDYIFGRGALDMKAGVAAQMTVMKYFSERPEELCGNLLEICECDEEGNSAGIFSALRQLVNLKNELGLDYVSCINSDYSTAERNDDSRYIYAGSIGKILPCFAVFGTPAHVGQVFASFDPNLVTAEITRRMSYSTRMCDSRLGETTLPPVSLKQADTKESYTVQTAISSYSYYNVFTFGAGAAEILGKCKKLAEEAMDSVISSIMESHSVWQKMAGTALPPLRWKTRALLWSEYVKELRKTLGSEADALINDHCEKLAKEKPDLDLREYSLKVCEFARSLDPDKSPLVLIFAGSTYYPPVEISGRNEKEANLLSAARKAAENNGNYHPIGVKMFYPYISDSSFMYVCSENGDAADLAANMPAWGYRYIHPEEHIKAVDAPVLNIGTFGYDGHMYTERAEKKHCFETVPQMIKETVSELLK